MDDRPSRPLTSGQAELAASYFRLAMWFGGQFAARHRLDTDEVCSYLDERVCLIARDYDPAKFSDTEGHFVFRLRACLVDYLRHERRRGQVRVARSLDDPGLSVVDRDLLPAAEDRERVESLLRRLPADRAALLRRHYLDGEPREAIARDLGVGREAMDKRICRSLAELRDPAPVPPPGG